MGGAIPPLPQYAFMALCSVKAQGQLYLCQRLKEFALVRGNQGREEIKTFEERSELEADSFGIAFVQ
jgi:hypothetical protein